MNLFGTDGVRGLVNAELNSMLALKLGASVAHIVKDELNKLSYKGTVKTLCVPSAFIKHASIEEQIAFLNISLEDLANIL